MSVHPIEAESYRILAARVDLSGWPPGPAAVAARVVHATAEPSLLVDLVVPEEAVEAGVGALRAGAPVICDVEMVRSGISGAPTVCFLRDTPSPGTSGTRSAAAMAEALARHPEGAVVVVGCAPTALAEVVRMVEAGHAHPALVIGVPVGFVGAAETNRALQDLSDATGLPAITLHGERGGAAIAAAVVNALVRLAHAGTGAVPDAPPLTARATVQSPACLLIGHGTRSARGERDLRHFCAAVAAARPGVRAGAGFIEFVEPGLDTAVDDLVASGATQVAAVPLVLFGAGHMKDDGPAALARARDRHPGVAFTYARDLGVHPGVLSVVAERIVGASAGLPDGRADAAVIVGRGSSDPDANGDLAKAARLLADGRGLTSGTGATSGGTSSGSSGSGSGGPGIGGQGTGGGPPPLGLVVPAFVSLARPGVAAALDQCMALGARRIAVVPYFLFDGLLVERIGDQVAAWSAANAGVAVQMGTYMGTDPRLVDLVWQRYDEAVAGSVHMNCDGCLYRAPMPGYEHRVGARWLAG